MGVNAEQKPAQEQEGGVRGKDQILGRKRPGS